MSEIPVIFREVLYRVWTYREVDEWITHSSGTKGFPWHCTVYIFLVFMADIRLLLSKLSHVTNEWNSPWFSGKFYIGFELTGKSISESPIPVVTTDSPGNAQSTDTQFLWLPFFCYGQNCPMFQISEIPVIFREVLYRVWTYRKVDEWITHSSGTKGLSWQCAIYRYPVFMAAIRLLLSKLSHVTNEWNSRDFQGSFISRLNLQGNGCVNHPS